MYAKMASFHLEMENARDVIQIALNAINTKDVQNALINSSLIPLLEIANYVKMKCHPVLPAQVKIIA